MNGKSVVITAADFDRLNGLVRSNDPRRGPATPGASLGQELSRGEVVPPTDVPRGVVTMNSRVRVRDEDGDEPEDYTLVYPQDADIDEGRVSVLAPMGMALLGAKVGDVVEVRAPAGVRRLRIDRLLYQPEAAGDYHL
jgi:regulator of nucleoside diphosphate kinase